MLDIIKTGKSVTIRLRISRMTTRNVKHTSLAMTENHQVLQKTQYLPVLWLNLCHFWSRTWMKNLIVAMQNSTPILVKMCKSGSDSEDEQIAGTNTENTGFSDTNAVTINYSVLTLLR